MFPFVKASIFSALLILSVSAAHPRSSTVAPDDDGGFRTVALKIHNHYRTQYSAPPLEMDYELNSLAHAHAEKLASSKHHHLSPSNSGFHENLWSHRGELLPLAKDCEYAIKNWYTGSKTPGKVNSSVDHSVLRSDSVKRVGFGVGTTESNGDGYTVVVAFYS